MASTPASLNKFATGGSKGRFCSIESEIKLGKIGQIEQNKEKLGCHWEKLVSDAADLLIFDSFIIEETSDGRVGKTLNFETTSCASTVLELPLDNNGSLQKTHAVGSCKERDMESHVVEFVLALQEIGCFSVVLKCVLALVAAATIGIGARPFYSGQVNGFFSFLYYS
ncbi:hypothetical protein LOK49_LG07G01354 [Camellia lanceoleosa]|uniref:Uncharacterized protein n=1 Tax=Camellia lanceoleosa TaxID=1840588 RepID=A0ACC0H1L6_9ERIC|nr:hypothetical protein LOK49_LG07G01354 [Camellia lanceoleosa]